MAIQIISSIYYNDVVCVNIIISNNYVTCNMHFFSIKLFVSEQILSLVTKFYMLQLYYYYKHCISI